MQRVAIIGAGTMGSGIAMACANAGLDVRLYRHVAGGARPRARRDPPQLRNLGEARTVHPGHGRRAARPHPSSADVSTASTRRMSSSKPCSRSWRSRQQVFAELDRGGAARCGPRHEHVDARHRRDRRARRRGPGDVIGLHFFSPANVMRLLEIVRGGRHRAATAGDGAGASPRRSARSASSSATARASSATA